MKEKIKRYLRDLPDKKKYVGVLCWQILGSFYNFFIKRIKIKGHEELDKSLFLANVCKRYFSTDKIRDNSYYGHGKILIKSDIPGINNNIYIEHGLFFGKHFQRQDEFRFSKLCMTFSKERAKLIENETHMQAIAVGPYIKYAKINDADIINLRKKYGRFLLHFPYHSTDGINLKVRPRNQYSLLGEYDTKLACVYYKDLCNKNFIEELKRDGFKIVSAGHKFNPNFLINLKKLIVASVFTSSDYLGTQVGYCIHCKKGHYIFNERDIRNSRIKSSYGKSYMENIESTTHEINELTKIISKNMGEGGDVIEVMNKYWGFDVDKPIIK